MILSVFYVLFVLFINMKKKIWTDDDVLMLVNAYPDKTDSELEELFPNRTLTSIKVKAKKLNLKKTNEANFKNRSLAQSGEKNGMYGKKNKLKNKTYLDVYGEEKSADIKHKLSIHRKNNPKDISGHKNPMYGKTPHNKGTKITDKHRKILSEKAIERYKCLSDEEKNRRKKIWFNKVYKKKYNKDHRTKPESIFEDILLKLNIVFEPQAEIGYYLVDYIVGKLAFEIQGDYWHGNPDIYSEEKLNKTQKKNINRDQRKKTFLEKNGYDVFYFWETDLIKNKEMCFEILKKIIDER